MKLDRVTILTGDCQERLAELPDECVDVLCCDPPYGLKFMNRDWDRAVPPVDAWRECLRVMKPGAFGFILCTPRQDCMAQMIVRLGEAGFEAGFTSIYWVYASGFPKAQNLSKAADKRAGAEREVVGRNPNFRDPGKNAEHHARWNSASMSPNVTEPSTPEAKALDGAYGGFQPKPAVEPVIVVMKPLAQKTYLDQALNNGKGCTWLDDGRIPITGSTKGSHWTHRREIGDGNIYHGGGFQDVDHGSSCPGGGRFPANVLVEDDALDDGRICKSGKMSGSYHGFNDGNIYGKAGKMQREYARDAGSASRYFDLDAWHAKAMAELPERVRRTFPWLLVPKPSKREKNRGVGDNQHPTVKPTKLMQYLITIGSRKGDVVLDPYCGSGTTGAAAVALSRRFVGVELDPKWADTARRRIAGVFGPLFADLALEEMGGD